MQNTARLLFGLMGWTELVSFPFPRAHSTWYFGINTLQAMIRCCFVVSWCSR